MTVFQYNPATASVRRNVQHSKSIRCRVQGQLQRCYAAENVLDFDVRSRGKAPLNQEGFWAEVNVRITCIERLCAHVQDLHSDTRMSGESLEENAGASSASSSNSAQKGAVAALTNG